MSRSSSASALWAVPALVGMALKNQADALNAPWTPLWIMLGGVGLNALLNAAWIHGYAGFPACGLEGAGYATLTSRLVVAAALFVWMGRSVRLKDWMPQQWGCGLELAGLGRLLRLGLPAGLHLLAEVSMFMVAALLVGSLGVVPLAAHQITLTCASVTFMVPLGISMAITVRVGELTGAGQTQRRHAVLLGGWGLGWLAALGSMALFFGLGRQVAWQFVRDPAVVQLALPLLIVAGFFQLGDAIQVISAGALRGVQEAVVVSTCNRVEIYAAAESAGAAAEIDQWLRDRFHLSDTTAFFRHVREEAARHLFAVVSGLESMVATSPAAIRAILSPIPSIVFPVAWTIPMAS